MNYSLKDLFHYVNIEFLKKILIFDGTILIFHFKQIFNSNGIARFHFDDQTQYS